MRRNQEDIIIYLPNDGTPSAALLDKGLPHLGEVIDAFDTPIVVVGTFCIFGTFESRFFTAVTIENIDRYLDWASQQNFLGATKYREPKYRELFHDLNHPSGQAESVEERWAFSFPQNTLQEMTKLGKHDLGLSEEHQEALKGHCAHHQFFDVNGKTYVVAGHILTRKEGKQAVTVALFACKGGDLYKTVPLERLLPHPKPREERVQSAQDSVFPKLTVQ